MNLIKDFNANPVKYYDRIQKILVWLVFFISGASLTLILLGNPYGPLGFGLALILIWLGELNQKKKEKVGANL